MTSATPELFPCPFCLDSPGFVHPDLCADPATPEMCGECSGSAVVGYDCRSYGLEPLPAPEAKP